MDFWASLEHELSYKFPEGKKKTITHELRQCADVIAETDLRMQRLHNINYTLGRNDKGLNINTSTTKVFFQKLKHPVFLLKQKLFFKYSAHNLRIKKNTSKNYPLDKNKI